MASFLLIRLLRWSVGLLLILFVTYAMMYYGAGDPIRMMFIQGEDFDTEDEAVMRALRAKIRPGRSVSGAIYQIHQ